MTTFRLLHAAGVAALLGATAFAWAGPAMAQSTATTQQGHEQQRRQYRRNVDRQKLTNQLRDSRIDEQQRQRISDGTKRPYANDAATTQQIRQADKARRNGYQSRRQGVLESYEDAVTPRVVPPSASSGDKDASSDGH